MGQEDEDGTRLVDTIDEVAKEESPGADDMSIHPF
jgi:hypothetical protein